MPRPNQPVEKGTFGWFIRDLREKAEKSLEQVAAGKYSTSLISQLERNRIDPSPEVLEHLAHVYGMHPDDMKAEYESRSKESATAPILKQDEICTKINALIVEGEIDKAYREVLQVNIFRVTKVLQWRFFGQLGYCLHQMGQYSRAYQALTSSVQTQPQVIAEDLRLEQLMYELCLAESATKIGKLNESLESYEDIRTLQSTAHFSPALKDVYRLNFGLGQALLAQSQSTHESPEQIKFLNQALSCFNICKTISLAINAFFLGDKAACGMARIYILKGEFGRAQKLLDEVLKRWDFALAFMSSKQIPSQILLGSIDYNTNEVAQLVSTASSLLASLLKSPEDFKEAAETITLARQTAEISGSVVCTVESYLVAAQIAQLHAPGVKSAIAAYESAHKLLISYEDVPLKLQFYRQYMQFFGQFNKLEAQQICENLIAELEALNT